MLHKLTEHVLRQIIDQYADAILTDLAHHSVALDNDYLTVNQYHEACENTWKYYILLVTK